MFFELMKISKGRRRPRRHDVVDRDVERMLALRPLELVGMPLERRRPVERLGDVDHLAVADRDLLAALFGLAARNGVGRLAHGEHRCP
jgi:hypothetical protein